MATLDGFIGRDLSRTDPKGVPACVGGELTLPLIDQYHPPIAEKQRRVSPYERGRITEEVLTLLDPGATRPSKSPWAAQVSRVKERMGLCGFASTSGNLIMFWFRTPVDWEISLRCSMDVEKNVVLVNSILPQDALMQPSLKQTHTRRPFVMSVVAVRV